MHDDLHKEGLIKVENSKTLHSGHPDYAPAMGVFCESVSQNENCEILHPQLRKGVLDNRYKTGAAEAQWLKTLCLTIWRPAGRWFKNQRLHNGVQQPRSGSDYVEHDENLHCWYRIQILRFSCIIVVITVERLLVNSSHVALGLWYIAPYSNSSKMILFSPPMKVKEPLKWISPISTSFQHKMEMCAEVWECFPWLDRVLSSR